MKIGCAVPLYNREKFIGPFLDMLLENEIEPVIALSDTPWGNGTKDGGNEETLERDRTEYILDTFFPQVKVIKGTYLKHGDSFAVSIEALQHCDRILTLDSDLFFTNEDFKKLKEFISQDFPVFLIDHERMMVEYYYDYNYGHTALYGGQPPILAVKPGVQVLAMTSWSGRVEWIAWEDKQVKGHHFRFCKPNGSGAYRCEKPTSSEGYSRAPEEIISRLTKWEFILN